MMHLALSGLAFWGCFSRKSRPAQAQGPAAPIRAPGVYRVIIGQAPMQEQLPVQSAIADAQADVAAAPAAPADSPTSLSLQRRRHAVLIPQTFLSADPGIMPITRKARHLHTAWVLLHEVSGTIRNAYRIVTQPDRYIYSGGPVSMPDDIPAHWTARIQDLMSNAQILDYINSRIRHNIEVRERQQQALLNGSRPILSVQHQLQQPPVPPRQQTTTPRRITFDGLPMELKMMIWTYAMDVPQCRYFHELFNLEGEHQPGLRFTDDAALWNVNTEWRQFMRHEYAKVGVRISREGCHCSRQGRRAITSRIAAMEYHWCQISVYNEQGIRYRNELANFRAAILALVVSLFQWLATVQQTDARFAAELNQAYLSLRQIGTIQQELRQLLGQLVHI